MPALCKRRNFWTWVFKMHILISPTLWDAAGWTVPSLLSWRLRAQEVVHPVMCEIFRKRVRTSLNSTYRGKLTSSLLSSSTTIPPLPLLPLQSLIYHSFPILYASPMGRFLLFKYIFIFLSRPKSSVLPVLPAYALACYQCTRSFLRLSTHINNCTTILLRFDNCFDLVKLDGTTV